MFSLLLLLNRYSSLIQKTNHLLSILSKILFDCFSKSQQKNTLNFLENKGVSASGSVGEKGGFPQFEAMLPKASQSFRLPPLLCDLCVSSESYERVVIGIRLSPPPGPRLRHSLQRVGKTQCPGGLFISKIAKGPRLCYSFGFRSGGEVPWHSLSALLFQ